MAETVTYYDLKSLSELSGLTENALRKRAARLSNSDTGLIDLGELGYFIVRKKGRKEYRFIPIDASKCTDVISKAEASQSMRGLLEKLKIYACEKCKATIDKVIRNV